MKAFELGILLIGVVLVIGVVAISFKVLTTPASTQSITPVSASVVPNPSGGAVQYACQKVGGWNGLTLTFQANQVGQTGTHPAITLAGTIGSNTVSALSGSSGQANLGGNAQYNVVAFASGFLNQSVIGQVPNADDGLTCRTAYQAQVPVYAAGGLTAAFYAQNGTATCESYSTAGTASGGLGKASYVVTAGNASLSYLTGYPTVDANGNPQPEFELALTSNQSGTIDQTKTMPSFAGSSCSPDKNVNLALQGESDKFYWICKGQIANSQGGQSLYFNLNTLGGSNGKTPSVSNTSMRYYIIPRVWFIDGVTGLKLFGVADGNNNVQQSGQAIWANNMTLCQ